MLWQEWIVKNFYTQIVSSSYGMESFFFFSKSFIFRWLLTVSHFCTLHKSHWDRSECWRYMCIFSSSVPMCHAYVSIRQHSFDTILLYLRNLNTCIQCSVLRCKRTGLWFEHTEEKQAQSILPPHQFQLTLAHTHTCCEEVKEGGKGRNTWNYIMHAHCYERWAPIDFRMENGKLFHAYETKKFFFSAFDSTCMLYAYVLHRFVSFIIIFPLLLITIYHCIAKVIPVCRILASRNCYNINIFHYLLNTPYWIIINDENSQRSNMASHNHSIPRGM